VINIPYRSRYGSYETAKGIGHVPIVKNEFVQKKLRDYHMAKNEKIENLPLDFVYDLSKDIENQNTPDYVICCDGSSNEIEADERFPSTRLGYLQIAAVLILLDDMLVKKNQPFVDPLELKKTIKKSIQPMVLPGANIREKSCDDLNSSWRQDIYEIFSEYGIEDRNILDVFWELLKYSGINETKYRRVFDDKVKIKQCPATSNCVKEILVPKEGIKCPNCNKDIFPTDVLRMHEEVKESQSNTGALNRVMNCLENIYIIGCLQYLLSKRPDDLHKFSFIIDGPLAIFGPPAWLHNAIFNFINNKLYQTLRENNYDFPIIFGVEKSGPFVEHSEIIKKFLKPQNIFVLTEDYIYKYILSSKKPLSGIYGAGTYYGQKLIYKTKKNQMITFTIPKTQKGPSTTDIINHPTLIRTLNLLDQIGTLLYKDALIPISLAHSYASIPLKTGTKVLKILTQREMNLK
jgi:hypothetical protein